MEPACENNTSTTLQQADVNVQKTLTPEQEEELKLRSKYPNKPGGSAFIQKMLHKGHKKYFDSGDYNMAKQSCKNKLPPPALSTITSSTPVANSPESASNSPTPTTPASTKVAINKRATPLSAASYQSPVVQSNSNVLVPSITTTHATPVTVTTPSTQGVPATNHQIIVNSIDPVTDNLLIEDAIGHEIPTPESLTTRKHSSVTSKLATELSS